MPFLWGSIWTQLFFLLSGFVLAYAEMVRPKSSAGQLTQLQYTWRRLKKIYPPYLLTIFISMIQISHSAFEWKTLILNLLLLQAWIPMVNESNPLKLEASTTSWVGVSWFLSALLLYWQFLRPAARFCQRMSMKLALLSLLCLWLWTAVMLYIWMNVCFGSLWITLSGDYCWFCCRCGFEPLKLLSDGHLILGDTLTSVAI